MTYWQQGSKEEARAMFDKAVAWADKDKPNDAELRLSATRPPLCSASPRTSRSPRSPRIANRKPSRPTRFRRSKPTPKDVLADILGAIGAIIAPLHSGLLLIGQPQAAKIPQHALRIAALGNLGEREAFVLLRLQ